MASQPFDPNRPLPSDVIHSVGSYPKIAKLVFVGHYWLTGPRPELLRHNIACVDWSVTKGGSLCAYRWDGERELDPVKFFWTV